MKKAKIGTLLTNLILIKYKGKDKGKKMKKDKKVAGTTR